MKTLVLRFLDGLARDHETTGGFDLIADLI